MSPVMENTSIISRSVDFSTGFIRETGIPRMMHARSQWLCDKILCGFL